MGLCGIDAGLMGILREYNRAHCGRV